MLTRLAEIDLRQPLPSIVVDERYSRLSVLARWGHCPLGTAQFRCQPGMTAFSAEQLKQQIVRQTAWTLWERAIAGDLEKLNGEGALPLPPLTVVVCTRDRPLLLQRCLASLARLDYPHYEVVVVDNASRDPAVAQVVAQSGCRHVREERPGLDWARNRGIGEATHDLIAFIDDDALAAPGWLRGMALGFEDPEIMAVTGLVLPAEIDTPAQAAFEYYGGMGKGFVPRTVRREALAGLTRLWASSWGVGTNMAFRRALFAAVGPFDPALDVGTPAGGGGDLEFFQRLVAEGHALRYEPAALVYHLHRRDREGLRRQIYHNGRSFGAYLLTVAHNYPRQRAAVLHFALRRWLWQWLLKRLLKGAVGRDRLARDLALTELWGACSSLSAYRRSKRQARQLEGGR